MPGDSIPSRTYALAAGLSLLANVGMISSMASLGSSARADARDESAQLVSIVLDEPEPRPTAPAPDDPQPPAPDQSAHVQASPAPPVEPPKPVKPPEDEASVKLGNPDAPDSASKAWLGVSENATPGGRHASTDQALFQPGRPGAPGPAQTPTATDAAPASDEAHPPEPLPRPSQAQPAPQSVPQPVAPPGSRPPVDAPASAEPAPDASGPRPPVAADDPSVGPLTPAQMQAAQLQPQPPRPTDVPPSEASESDAPASPAAPHAATPTRPAAPGPPTPATGDGGLGDQSESDSFTTSDTIDYRPGRPLAARGLKIITVRPNYSLATLAVRTPRVALVRMVFGRDGKVLRAGFVDGRDAGHRDFNEPLMDAVHRWRAEGPQLLKLPADKPNAGLAVTIRFEVF